MHHRLAALARLGGYLLEKDDYLDAVIHRTAYNNPWFTKENQERAIRAIATQFLNLEKLQAWANGYEIAEAPLMKTIGLVMAGNIPLVGFHDLLCTFVAGHKAQIKLSDKDRFLLPHLLNLLEKFAPGAADYFEIVEQLKGFDAVIATGSNNSARYFEAYFGKYPHIIRKNRNGVAVLDGSESEEELLALGKDVFRFFGLGCRNVSKIYVPQGYDFQPLMERLHEYRDIVLHDKYKNNFDHNLAFVMLNRTPYLNNGCIILTESQAIASRIAMLHYEFYEDKNWLEMELKNRQEEIQCVVAKPDLLKLPVVAFGKTQEPGLADYPDGVDVMGFLSGGLGG
ncbi:MAG: acyl-CoA reductase [Bacteroidetes bacterium]|nr:acyl-CoA reductase [Bacteroidota bacterium]